MEKDRRIAILRSFKQLENPPLMKKKEQIFDEFGLSRSDPYFWFREKDNPEVIKHLNEENTFFHKHIELAKGVESEIFNKMKSREPRVRYDAPEKDGAYYYQEVYPENCEYVQIWRWKEEDSRKKLLFDFNSELTQYKNRRIESWQISPSHSRLAMVVDLDGSEFGHIFWLDLSTGELIKTSIEMSCSSIQWSLSEERLYWVELDSDSRPFAFNEYDLTSDSNRTLYEDNDPAYFLSIDLSSSEKFLFFCSYSVTDSEVKIFNLATSKLESLFIRGSNRLVYFDHHENLGFIAQSNHRFKDQGLYLLDSPRQTVEKWKILFESRDNIILSSYAVGEHHIVLSTFEGGLPCAYFLDTETLELESIESPLEGHWIESVEEFDFKMDQVLLNLCSMTSPSSVYVFDLKTREVKFYHQVKIEGDFKSSDYICNVEYVTSEDGFVFPVTMAFRKDQKRDKMPVILYGYGSYGSEMTPFCGLGALELMDRGAIYAIAYIRGGGEHGQANYESQGKFLNKKNTFYDFKCAAQMFIDRGFCDKGMITLWGGSAGGLLVGATMNLDPGLYSCVVGEVAFVDVLNTILDETLYLTPREWEEWGNPKDKIYYDYIRSYSPYDNIREISYPACLFTGGLNDPRVTYWEPAKMVARLRELNKSERPILLYTNMDSGHGGESGRYSEMKEEAMIITFVLLANNMI